MERFNKINKIITAMTEEEFAKMSNAHWEAVFLENTKPFEEITKTYGITVDDVTYWLDYND